MNKLMSADFARLKKDKIFWIGMAFMFVLGGLVPIMNFLDTKKYGYATPIDSGFFTYIIYIGILLSAFCSLYIGTEFSDGTIRNKIVVGHKRAAIYLSNLIVCAVAGILLCFAYLLPYVLIGYPLLGHFRLDVSVIAGIVLCSLVLALAFSSIFTLVAMLNQSKAIVAVINILGVFILLFAAIYFSQKLNEPQMYEGYVYIDENGETVTEEEQVNPNYVTGTKRDVYTFLLDFLPTGQAVQLSSASANQLPVKALYSMIIVIVTTGCGVYFFRKKDLK